MVLNWISVCIICIVLVWHIVRSIRLWCAARTFSVFSILSMLAMAALLVAMFNADLRWLKWVGGVFVLLAFLWRKNPAGAALTSCEDVLIIAGDPNDGLDDSTWEERMDEFDEIQIIRQVKKEREKQIEARQAEWAEQFVASAPARKLALDVPIQVTVPADFPTSKKGVKLRFSDGVVNAQFSNFEEKIEKFDERFVGCRIELMDATGQAWQADYAVECEAIFEIGFSIEGPRTADEFTGWTEAPGWMRGVFSSSCVLAQLKACLEGGEFLTLKYSDKSYDFRTKYFGAVMDLAWSAEKGSFFIRGSNLYFNGLNGIPGEFIGSEDSCSREVWGDECAEPVVFPILPHELLPFLFYSVSGEYEYGDQPVNSEICFRKIDSTSDLAPSSSVEPVSD